MGMQDTVIPSRIDSSAVDGTTMDVNASSQLKVKESFIAESIELPQAEAQVQIIELQANATITPLDHDSLISETFSDATGYNNYVNVGNTTGTFSTNQYVRGNAYTLKDNDTTGGDTLGFGNGTSSGYGGGFTTTSAFTLKRVALDLKKVSAPTGTISCKIYSDSGGSPNALLATSTTTIDATTLTTSFGVWYNFVFNLALSNATKYWIQVSTTGSDGANYLQWNVQTGGGTGLYAAWNGSWGAPSGGGQVAYKTYSATATDKITELDLPTITGTVTHTLLTVLSPNREAGDSIKYNLVDTDSTSDDDLEVDTKNALTLCDGTKITGGKIQIQLNKGTSETESYPSVRSICLKIWKA